MKAVVEHRTLRNWKVVQRLEGEFKPEDIAKINFGMKRDYRIKAA